MRSALWLGATKQGQALGTKPNDSAGVLHLSRWISRHNQFILSISQKADLCASSGDKQN
jgi:hypothetical protein